MKTQKFTIFFTAVIHGRDIESARLFSLYKQHKEQAEADGRICLLFDSGDSSDRCVDYCSLTKCKAYSHILNRFDYDAQTIGNDIGLVYGPRALKNFLKNIHYPVLGANFRNGDEPLLEGLKDNILIERAGLKIGVFGLTNPWGNAYESYGYRFPDTKECAARQVKILKDKGADFMIFLSHMGIMEEMDIVFDLPEVNIVIGGHSHSLTPGGFFNHHNTVFHHCGSYAEHIGRIDFKLERSDGKIQNVKAALCSNSESEKPADEILEAIGQAKEDAAEVGNQILGKTEVPLVLEYHNECNLGNFTADALKHFTKAEMAIVAGGNLSKGIDSGNITMADLNRACFSTANPCVSKISGKSLRESFEKGLDKNFNSHYHHGLRGAPIGIPQISGLSVSADLSRPVGNRILEIVISGNPVDENKSYSIAHTDLENHKKLDFFPQYGHKLKTTEEMFF